MNHLNEFKYFKLNPFLIEIYFFRSNFQNHTFSLQQLAFRKVLNNFDYRSLPNKQNIFIPFSNLKNIHILHFIYHLKQILTEKLPNNISIPWNNHDQKPNSITLASFFSLIIDNFKIKHWHPNIKFNLSKAQAYYNKAFENRIKINIQKSTLQRQ